MGTKRKLLYATLFASSCLFSTNVVKADQVDVNQEKNAVQNTAANTQGDTETNTDDQTAVNIKTDQTDEVTKTSNQAQDMVTDTQQTQSENSQPAGQNVADQSVDGVYTTNSTTSYIPLYTADGNVITGRGLSGNSGWYADTLHNFNGTNYYRVSTSEYANSNDGAFQSYVQPYQGNATVVYKAGASVHSFNGYGNHAVYEGNNLDTGTSWKINNHALIGGKEWYQISSDTWLPQDYVVVNNGQYKDADWITGVPLIAQRPELPNGCEITAVTMMLQYAGANVDKMQMAREMPRSSDPNYGYIGQPWDLTGITIFPSALMGLVEKYTGTAKNLTGQGFDAIKYQINLGHPVVTWNTLYGFPYHALVVTGYDSKYVYYNDCWTDQTLQMGIDQFINNWNTQNRRAISY